MSILLLFIRSRKLRCSYQCRRRRPDLLELLRHESPILVPFAPRLPPRSTAVVLVVDADQEPVPPRVVRRAVAQRRHEPQEVRHVPGLPVGDHVVEQEAEDGLAPLLGRSEAVVGERLEHPGAPEGGGASPLVRGLDKLPTPKDQAVQHSLQFMNKSILENRSMKVCE